MAEAALPFHLSGPMALRIIRDIAQDSSRVILTAHARRRMRERRISMPQVLACLLQGQLQEGPARDTHGNWVCALRWRHAGDYLKAVVAIKHETSAGRKLIVITVIHED